jgi:hypothetical protein
MYKAGATQKKHGSRGRPHPHPLYAPIFLTIGSGIIKIIDSIDRVSFILTLGENEPLAEILQLAVDYSWVAFLVGAIWWYLSTRPTKKKRRPNYGLSFTIISIIAFIMGAIVSSQVSTQPVIITGWGNNTGPTPLCRATIQTRKLRDFMHDHDLVLVCGPVDPTRDHMRDDRVHMSSAPRTIVLPSLEIVSFLSVAEGDAMRPYNKWWFQAVLVPKKVNPSLLQTSETMEDLQALGGVIVGNDPVRLN